MSSPPVTSSDDSVWISRRTDVVERRCGTSVLLLPRDGSDVVQRLDGVTAAVWAALAAPTALDELVRAATSGASGVAPPADVAMAVAHAVKALERAGLVSVRAGTRAFTEPSEAEAFKMPLGDHCG